MSAQLAPAPTLPSAFASSMAATGFLEAGAAESRDAYWDGGLATAGGVQHIVSDSEIYGEGGEAVFFYKVVRGMVRTCKFLSDGRRQIEAFYEEGDTFGFEAGDKHRVTAEAVMDCSLVAYRRKGIERLALSNEALSQQLFGYFIDGMTRAQEHALILGRRSAVERVGVFLHALTQRSSDARTINLALTRQDIADYLGLTIETVSRTFSQLERDAIIALPTPREVKIQNPAWLKSLCA